MKKLIVIALIALVTSCMTGPRNRGVYNPGDADESALCTLNIDKFAQISQFDDVAVSWSANGMGQAPQTVMVAAGPHTMSIRYADGSTYSYDRTIVFLTEEGGTYRITFTITGSKILFDVVDAATGNSVKLDTSVVAGSDADALSSFIKYVLNPTMDEVGHSVRMENADWILVFKTDMVFTLENKKTGTTVEGRHGFIMDFMAKKGTVYLFVCDLSKVSREDFLSKSGYESNSQYVMTPVRCGEKEVSFLFATPAELGGKELTFSLTEIK